MLLHLLIVYHNVDVVHSLRSFRALPLLCIHLLLRDLQEDFFEVPLILLRQHLLHSPQRKQSTFEQNPDYVADFLSHI